MKSYRQQVFCGGHNMAVVCTHVNDVKGALEIVNDIAAPGADYGVFQMVQFP
jgi:hypothetical protein